MPKNGKKGKKGKKDKIQKEEEPVKIIAKSEPKIKIIKPPKFDPLLSVQMFLEMKSDCDSYYYEKTLMQKDEVAVDDFENNDDLDGLLKVDKKISLKKKLTKVEHNDHKDHINKIINIQNDELINFNKDFYPKLYKIIKQLEIIKDSDTKNGNIKKTYNWYKDKKNSFNSLNPIEVITKKPYYDLREEPHQEINKTWEAQFFPITFEREFRSEDEHVYLPSKDR